MTLLAIGDDNGERRPVTLPEAAAKMSIKLATADRYRRHPLARKTFLELIDERREQELAANLYVAASIRNNDDKLPLSAAVQRARLDAIKVIEQRGDPAVNVNIGLGVGIAVQPGYLIDVSGHIDQVGNLVGAIMGRGRESPASVIDHNAADAPASSQHHSAGSPGPELGRQNVEQYPPRDSRRRARLMPIDDAVHD